MRCPKMQNHHIFLVNWGILWGLRSKWVNSLFFFFAYILNKMLIQFSGGLIEAQFGSWET